MATLMEQIRELNRNLKIEDGIDSVKAWLSEKKAAAERKAAAEVAEEAVAKDYAKREASARDGADVIVELDKLQKPHKKCANLITDHLARLYGCTEFVKKVRKEKGSDWPISFKFPEKLQSRFAEQLDNRLLLNVLKDLRNKP